MHVLATAGHVDHGKSTLVRALTGMEPDRWAEERARGMTIDLGYVWTTLPTGQVVGFVDVPGHQRFFGNMLAGLGPVPAVVMVIAADEGWCRQTAEHAAAIDALGVRHGLLVVSRCDLADPGAALHEGLDRLSETSLGAVEAVATSSVTGAGLDELRSALGRLVDRLPSAAVDADVRLWVDRVFTVRGSGTVVTGTLAAGTLRVGDELQLAGAPVRVRGLQSLGIPHESVPAVARVAVNLRGVDRSEVRRGDLLLTPGGWPETALVDVRLSVDATSIPAELVLHVGTAAVPVRVRPLGADLARLRLSRPVALEPGDRALLRNPGAQRIVAGVEILDLEPPELLRRGAAAARAQVLSAPPDLATEVRRVGAARRAELVARGVVILPHADVREIGPWLVAADTWGGWLTALCAAVDAHVREQPLDAGLPEDAAVHRLGLPDRALLQPLLDDAGLERVGGRLRRPGATPVLPAAVAELERRLGATPFAAPEQPELDALGLSRREIAAAVTAGRLLQITAGVVVLPDAPARALPLLAVLPQPFTTSAARQALGTTRRVALPLLEVLDSRGWTRRVDSTLREVVPGDW